MWIIELSVDRQNSDKAKLFTFPSITDKSTKVAYKRYEDADLIECSNQIPITWIGTNFVKFIRYLFLALTTFLVLLFVPKLHKKLSVKNTQKDEYTLPDEITPFSVATLLRNIAEDPKVKLTEQQQNELNSELQKIEKSFFSPDSQADNMNIKPVAEQWVKIANG